MSNIAFNYGAERSGNPGFGIDLLWTNPSPAASFTAKTITLDLTNYDLVMVMLRTSDAASARISTGFAEVDGGTAMAVLATTGNNNTGLRGFDVTTDGVKFEAGYWNGEQRNTHGIPVSIYGIHGIRDLSSD